LVASNGTYPGNLQLNRYKNAQCGYNFWTRVEI
jgi:hypothetical protein